MDKREKVLRLWELTDMENTISRVIQMHWQAQWADVPGLVDKLREETGFDIANQVFDIFSVSELLELMTPVMEEGLTGEELDGLIALYESPLGKMLVEKYPSLHERAFQVATEYTQRKVGEKLQELDFAEEDDEEGHMPHTYGSIFDSREHPDPDNAPSGSS